MIPENIEALRSRIAAAAERAGKQPTDITLVAVSKTFASELVREASRAGVPDFGENYVQELLVKREELSDLPLRWHFIGHLQSNKVRQIAGFVHLIHSVDDLKLAGEISKRAGQNGRAIDVLIEVHTTDEATKFGVEPQEVSGLVKEIAGLPNIRVQGLMTMGPFSDDPEDSRPCFRQVADIARSIDGEGIEGVTMKQLSMGMTHDFEVAIEEGATIVRVGTAIFGKRQKKT